MTETQELYTKWLRECPGADRFSIELFGSYPYQWRVSSFRSELFGEVILRGAIINGTVDQKREELRRQLNNIVAKLS